MPSARSAARWRNDVRSSTTSRNSRRGSASAPSVDRHPNRAIPNHFGKKLWSRLHHSSHQRAVYHSWTNWSTHRRIDRHSYTSTHRCTVATDPPTPSPQVSDSRRTGPTWTTACSSTAFTAPITVTQLSPRNLLQKKGPGDISSTPRPRTVDGGLSLPSISFQVRAEGSTVSLRQPVRHPI